MLEPSSLQVATLQDLSAELDKLKVKSSVELSHNVDDMATEVLHESLVT